MCAIASGNNGVLVPHSTVAQELRDPFLIHELLLSVTKTAFGCHPCRVVSVTYRQLRPFHGGNTGSNPVGDAKSYQRFRGTEGIFRGHKKEQQNS